MEPEPVRAALDELLRAAAGLPICDGAAKLHALVARLTAELGGRRDIGPSVEAVSRAATDALDADPWVRFQRAAVRLHHAHFGESSSPSAGVGAEPSGLAPQM